MRKIILNISFLLVACIGKSQPQQDSLITQTIIYHTKQAGKMYLVWDVNGWNRPENLPSKKYWNENSFVERLMVWSPMSGKKDSFSISVTLPKGDTLYFMFWIPIDVEGDSTDGWDTYGEQTYSSVFAENKKMSIDDSALWMPEKKPFNILEHGLKFFIISVVISAILIFFFRKKLAFSPVALITGCLLASAVLISIIRMQINNMVIENQVKAPGAAFPDFMWFASICVIFISIILLIKRHRRTGVTLAIACSLLLVVFSLVALLNLEIVKYLGRPLNYQWLYYSNFMAGADAKFALSENLTRELAVNVCFFLSGIIVFAVAYGFLPRSIVKKLNVGIAVLFAVVIVIGFYQYKNNIYESGKIENPVWELISSTIASESSSKLFSMEVSSETKKYLEDYHNQPVGKLYDTNHIINNIVVLVLESTPHSLVSLYDSTFNVTPNIKRWQNISSTYTNAYSHLPATVYSMGTMLAGIYPMISYKSMIAEYPELKLPTITSELNKQQWTSSIFFGADLAYSNIGKYVKNQNFSVAEDNTTISCKYGKFGETNTFLDQLDDRCLVDSYFKWADSIGSKKKFSMLWTIQTHYRYLFKGKEVEYVKDNKDLNRYLNALREDDAAFGMLMDGLKQRNLLNNTLVILTADHGEAFGTHDQIIHASKLYEENVRIPLVLYNPLLFKGERNNTISGLVDLPPTISHLTGFKQPTEWQGKSLFTPQANNGRTFFLCPFNDFLFGTRGERWKYIYNAAKDDGELYDVITDPKELKNVASSNPSIAKREFELLAGWVQYHNKQMKQFLK